MPPRRREPVKQRNRSLLLALALGGVLALGLVVGAVLLSGGGSSEAEPSVTAPVAPLDDIRQQGNQLGASSAKVTLIEYADFACPFCAQYATEVFPTIVERYVRPGKVKLEYRGLAFLAPIENSDRALRYALAAGEQGKLWDYAELIYANQGQEGTEWFTDAFARSLAEQIPGLDVDRLARDAESPGIESAIGAAAEEARSDGVSGTPSFFVKVDAEPAYPVTVRDLTPEAFAEVLDDALAE